MQRAFQHYFEKYPEVGVMEIWICDPKHVAFSQAHPRFQWWLYIFYLSKFYEVRSGAGMVSCATLSSGRATFRLTPPRAPTCRRLTRTFWR